MTRWFPALTAVIAVAACGVVHGLWTDRWGVSEEPARSAARLADVPLTLEGWDGSVHEMKGTTDLAGRIWLRYVQRGTGKAVNLLLVCDRSGPVSIHTPDVCYGAGGYAMGVRTKFSPKGGQPAEFFTALFRKTSASEQSCLRIFWAWNVGAGWQAADDPRTSFAGAAALFKLYLIRDVQPTEVVEDDPILDLMRQLLPELQKALFP